MDASKACKSLIRKRSTFGKGGEMTLKDKAEFLAEILLISRNLSKASGESIESATFRIIMMLAQQLNKQHYEDMEK